MAMNGMPRIILRPPPLSTGAKTSAFIRSSFGLRRGADNVTTTKRNQSTASIEEEQKKQKQEMNHERERLVQEAKVLTLSLYRTCVRSVRALRRGNEYDEKDFQEREQERLEPQKKDVRLSMLSMLPPVDRDDELRSRAEYYMQYARENFVQESDCLAVDDWQQQHVARYLFHLKRGDEHRKWLMKDMKFPDEYHRAFDLEQVNRFEERALAFAKKIQDQKEATLRPELREHLRQQSDGDTTNHGDDEDDDFFDEDDDDDDSPPEWYTRNRDRF